MRMSRRLALYGGVRTVPVQVYGAANETITITDGKNTYTVTTDASGKGTTMPEIKYGTYTVTGTISWNALPSGHTVTVDKNTTQITAWTGEMVYWFGVFADGVSYTSFNNASGYPVNQTNRIYVDPAQGYVGGLAFSPNMARGSATKLNSCITWNPQNSNYATCGIGLSTSAAVDTSGVASSYVAYVQGASKVTLYSCDISSLDAAAKYYIKMRQFGNEFYVHAVWFGDSQNESEGGGGGADSGVETLAGTNSVDVLDETYRYLSSNGAWSTAGSISTDNYVGANSSEVNSALIPVGSFSFDGNSTKLRLSFYGYCPSVNFYTKGFRWAICTSNANKALYQTTDDVTTDGTQVAKGTATFAYNNGTYKTYEIDLSSASIPSGTQLYVYLWPNGSATDIAHFRGTITASLYYEG